MEKHDHRHKEELLQQMHKYGQSKTIRNLPHLPIPVRSKSALLWPEYYY